MQRILLLVLLLVVQVLKNYDEVSQLGGVRGNEDNIAINIKLKEGKKNFWFGEVTAGLGSDERHLVHQNYFITALNTA